MDNEIEETYEHFPGITCGTMKLKGTKHFGFKFTVNKDYKVTPFNPSKKGCICGTNLIYVSYDANTTMYQLKCAIEQKFNIDPKFPMLNYWLPHSYKVNLDQLGLTDADITKGSNILLRVSSIFHVAEVPKVNRGGYEIGVGYDSIKDQFPEIKLKHNLFVSYGAAIIKPKIQKKFNSCQNH